MDNGRLNKAEDILADARAVDPSNAEVAASLTALATARAAIAERERIAEAERQAQLRRDAEAAEAARITEAERIAEAERQAEAARIAAEAKAAEDRAAADSIVPEEPALAKTFGIPDTSSTAAPGQEPSAVTPSQADRPEVAAETVAQPANAGTDSPVANRATPAIDIDSPVAVSSLNRVRYVAPKYPRNAQRRNQSGWVDVVFTVASDGSVKDIEVRASEPGDVFVNAAIKAVEKWEFEPVIQNGVAVEKRAGVRMLFALE
jgi:TonB family protein